MLDFELRVLLRQLAAIEAVDDLALHRAEPLGCRVGEGAHRDHRKSRVELDRRHRVAGRGADERPLEMRMRDRLVGADKAGAELHAGRAHFKIGQDRLAAANPAGDKDWDVAQMRQNLLRQNRGRYRADMAAGLAAFDDDRIGAHAHELSRQHESRRETQDARPAGTDALDRGPARDAAGQHDVPDAMVDADIDQLQELRVHRDQVDPERALGQRGGGRYLRAQQVGRHRARGDDAKPAGIGNRRDQVALRHPGHRPAHNGEIGAEKGAAALPQPVELGAPAVVLGARRSCGVRPNLRPLGGRQSLAHPGSSSPYAVCNARSASSVYSAAIRTLTLISEVEITWMLMPLSARVWNICLATPAWLRMPTPITETLTTFGSGIRPWNPTAPRHPSSSAPTQTSSPRETSMVR